MYNLKASDYHAVLMDAACFAVMEYIKSEKITTGVIVVERDGKFYEIEEIGWSFFLDDACEYLAKQDLTPVNFERLNGFQILKNKPSGQ